MIKSIAQIFSMHVIVKAIGLLTFVIILEFFSLEEFGKYSYLLLVLHLIGVIVDPFTASYLVDFKIAQYKKYNFGIFLFSVFLLPFFYVTLYIFNISIEIEVFLLFSLAFLANGMLKSFLNVYEAFFKYGLIDVFRQLSILLSTLGYFYIFEEYDFICLLKINYSTTLLVMLVLIPIYIKKEHVFFDIRCTTLKDLFFKSKFLIFYTAIIPLFSFIDSWFIEETLLERDLGLYSFSLKIYNISLMLVIPMFTVLNIRQIEIAKAEKYNDFLKNNFKKVLGYASCIFILFLVTNYIVSYHIYLDYKESFTNTSILLFGSLVAYITMPFSFLIAYRKYKVLFMIALISIFLNVLLNTLFIEKYGTIIAALSTVLSQIIVNFGSALISFFMFKEEEK